MNFLQAQQELSNRLNAFDYQVADDATRLKRWLNMAVQYICGSRIWPFMYCSEIVQTVQDYTTGTVSTVAGSTTVTFDGVISPSKVGYYIQFSDSNDWYKITSHSTGTASADITPPAINTNGTATFKIRKLHYLTSTPLISILDMKQLVTPTQVRSINPKTADEFLPLYYDAGTVYNYIISSPDSTGAIRFSCLYSPSSQINLMVRGIKKLTDLSGDSDEFVIPSPWHDVIINFAAYFGFQSIDESRATDEFKIGEKRLENMANTLTHDLGRHRVIQSNVGEGPTLTWTLPSNFGPEVY